MGEETEQINIVIPKSMKEWLDEHKEINRSKLFRDAVALKMNPIRKKVPPLVLFVGTMGPIFGIVLIAIGLTPTPMEVVIRAVLPILGGFLAVGTTLMYILERKRTRKEIPS